MMPYRHDASRGGTAVGEVIEAGSRRFNVEHPSTRDAECEPA
jgi:hypothetical protein